MILARGIKTRFNSEKKIKENINRRKKSIRIMLKAMENNTVEQQIDGITVDGVLVIVYVLFSG